MREAVDYIREHLLDEGERAEFDAMVGPDDIGLGVIAALIQQAIEYRHDRDRIHAERMAELERLYPV